MNIEYTILQTFHTIKSNPPEFMIEKGALSIVVFIEGHCVANKEGFELLNYGVINILSCRFEQFQKLLYLK